MVTQTSKFCHFGSKKGQAKGLEEKSRFRFVHQIGDGTYGEVFLAEAQDGRGRVRPYAIKQYETNQRNKFSDFSTMFLFIKKIIKFSKKKSDFLKKIY